MQPQQGQGQGPNGHIAMLNYRVTAVEQAMKAMQTQMRDYVSQKEHDLQLRGIKESMERIEKSVADLQTQMAEQKDSQDKLLIRILWSIVGGFGAVLIGVAIYYFTHLP